MATNPEQNYKIQIANHKKLAKKAVLNYPIKVIKIKFIHHGENTTFQISDSKNRKYLFRICRNDYHTKEALLEELKWLQKLHKSKKFQIPEPVKSKNKKYLEIVSIPQMPEGRKTVIFRWQEGRFISKTPSVKQMEIIGLQIAKLHNQSKKIKVVHRKYWTADGLIGKNAKYGAIDNLPGLTKVEQKKITTARKSLFNTLKKYEKIFPEKLGLIHSDIHSGNFLFNKKGLALIDFDDCGYGFYGYDLAIPLISLVYRYKLNKKTIINLRSAFFKGYRTQRILSQDDEAMVDQFILARRLLILGWLNARSEVPRLKKYFKKAVKIALKNIDLATFS